MYCPCNPLDVDMSAIMKSVSFDTTSLDSNLTGIRILMSFIHQLIKKLLFFRSTVFSECLFSVHPCRYTFLSLSDRKWCCSSINVVQNVMNTFALMMPNNLVAYSSDITPSVTDRFLPNQPDKGLLYASYSFGVHLKCLREIAIRLGSV